MIYFTSDCHFNHLNILKYEPITRPFETIEEMNEVIISNWNKKVKPEDTIYVLGDFFMGMADGVEPILDRLNGKIILIRGNHDSKSKIEIYKRKGIEVKDFDHFAYKGRYFILCHFPNESEEFVRMIIQDNSEVVWLYGHVHSNAPKGFHNGAYHIGVDTNNLTPVSIQEVWEACWPPEMMTAENEAYKAAHMADPIGYDGETQFKNPVCANISEYFSGPTWFTQDEIIDRIVDAWNNCGRPSIGTMSLGSIPQ